MKKLLLIVVCMLLLCNVAAATQTETFISLEDFNLYFNFAATITGSGNAIKFDNLEVKLGDNDVLVNDLYSVSLTDDERLKLAIYTPHIDDYDGTLPDINRIMLFYYPDGTKESLNRFLAAVYEIGVALGTVDITDEPQDFFETLGIFDTENVPHSVVLDGLSYYYNISEWTGFMLNIETPSN